MHTTTYRADTILCREKLVNTYLLAALVLVALASACQANPPAPPDAPLLLAVRTVAVRHGAMRETLAYVGTVHSRNEITILARMGGTVVDLPVREGAPVSAGAVLARVAAPETDARVSRVRAEIGRAEDESRFLCEQAEVDQRLLDTRAISPIQADTSRQRCETSRAGVRALRSSLKETEIMAAKTVERAPFDGTVLRWLAQPGENTMPGRPLVLVGDTPLEVRVRVSEKDMVRGLAPGLPVFVTSPARAEPLRASVSFVSPIASGPGRSVEVRIPVPEGERTGFSHGMSADVAFVLAERRDAVSVPQGAIVEAKEGSAVFVVEGDRVQRRDVEPDIRQEGWVALRPPLAADSRVVVGNLDALRDGQTVYPVVMAGDTP